jgi:hypothetical protein
MFFHQILEIPSKFHTLVDENLNWNTKPTKHFVQKWICSSLTIVLW